MPDLQGDNPLLDDLPAAATERARGHGKGRHRDSFQPRHQKNGTLVGRHPGELQEPDLEQAVLSSGKPDEVAWKQVLDHVCMPYRTYCHFRTFAFVL